MLTHALALAVEAVAALAGHTHWPAEDGEQAAASAGAVLACKGSVSFQGVCAAEVDR